MAKTNYPEIFSEKNITEEFIIIKVKQSTIDYRGSIYESTRGIWVIDPVRANNYCYVLSAVDQVVQEVFKVDAGSWTLETKPEKWALPEQKNKKFKKARYYFTGKALDDSDPLKKQVLGKRIPERFRKKGASNPIQYSS